MEIPNEFFTPSSLATLGGSTMAVWVLTSVVGTFMSPEAGLKWKRYISLALSLTFALIAASLVSDKTTWTWVIGVVNGGLIFLTANGGGNVASQIEGRRGAIRGVSESRRGSFFDPWW